MAKSFLELRREAWGSIKSFNVTTDLNKSIHFFEKVLKIFCFEGIHYILIPTSSWFKLEVVDGAHHMMILLIPEYILCAFLSSLSPNVIIPIMIKRTWKSSRQLKIKINTEWHIYQSDTYTLVLLDSLINEHSWSNQTKGLCTFLNFCDVLVTNILSFTSFWKKYHVPHPCLQ